MESFHFQSVTGKTLRLYYWPVVHPRAVVQLVHGMAEHMGRYDRLARALNEADFTVVGHDHLGHGPEAAPEDHGWFGRKNGWDNLIADIHGVTGVIRERYPRGVPLALLGHSMGSFAVREYLLRYGRELDACVLSGTGWYPPALCAAARALAAACGTVRGWHRPAPLINSIGFGSSNKAFQPARTPFDWLSRDEKEVDKYIADPLCGFLFTARGYYDLFDGLLGLSRVSRLSAMPQSLPVYFLSGAVDPVGQAGAGVKTVAEQFRAAGMRDVSVRLYEGGRHEMFNEINRDEATGELIAWLREKLPAPAARSAGTAC